MIIIIIVKYIIQSFMILFYIHAHTLPPFMLQWSMAYQQLCLSGNRVWSDISCDWLATHVGSWPQRFRSWDRVTSKSQNTIPTEKNWYSQPLSIHCPSWAVIHAVYQVYPWYTWVYQTRRHKRFCSIFKFAQPVKGTLALFFGYDT